MDNEKKLRDIFEGDTLGLLNIKPASSPARNEEERLLASFQEIIDFYEKNKREPLQGEGIQEHQLYSRLKSLRENTVKSEILKKYDTYGLLIYEQKQIKSIDDIINDDPLGLLKDDSEGLFDLKHIKSEEERASADFVARRKPCKDFDKYEQLFKDCQQDLKSGNRKLFKFNENQIQEGAFFVFRGILVYVKALVDITVDKFGKRDGRTELIFENGTESNMLFRSLGKGLFEGGKGVTFTDSAINVNFQEKYMNVTSEDKEAGYIYILKSKSEKPEIKELSNLYKIGYSTISVEERIKNASQKPTYLMADVRIIVVYKCYNMNPQKLELMLHTFFGKSCLNIDVFDNEGMRHTPREWFIAPLSVIEQVVQLIISGEILKYRYDSINSEVIINSFTK